MSTLHKLSGVTASAILTSSNSSPVRACHELLRLGQFGLDHAPSLFQGFDLPFRRGDDLFCECCE